MAEQLGSRADQRWRLELIRSLDRSGARAGPAASRVDRNGWKGDLVVSFCRFSAFLIVGDNVTPSERRSLCFNERR